jgi:hypothetical protein
MNSYKGIVFSLFLVRQRLRVISILSSVNRKVNPCRMDFFSGLQVLKQDENIRLKLIKTASSGKGKGQGMPQSRGAS